MIVIVPNRPPVPSTVLVGGDRSRRGRVHGGTPADVRNARGRCAGHVAHLDDFDVAFTRAVERGVRAVRIRRRCTRS